MFLFKASRYLEELKERRPDFYQASEKAIANIQLDADFVRVNKESFEACPDDSVEYAVMERITQSVVVSMDCGLSDIGSWLALWEIVNKDERGNVCRGDVINIDTSNSYINAQ
jgi:mannose-1-phosphate guanylyltransferase